MAPRIDDRWLWLGLGAVIILAAHGIRSAITDVVRLTEFDPAQFPENDALQDDEAENTIPTSALQTLATHPNHNIANAAISLVMQRLISDGTLGELDRDAKSPDETTRNKARTAATFVRDFPGVDGAYQIPWTEDEDDDADDDEDGSWRTVSVDGGERLGMTMPSEQTPVAGWTSVPHERPPLRDDAESERRRQHREAMVLHEGAGGFEEGDIIRPR